MDTAMPSDKPSASPSGERWVTLRELAEIRGISQHSAARLVRRHGWRRQTDNRGLVRALVPLEALDRPSAGPDTPAGGPVMLGELAAALEPMTVLLREQLERERGRADRAEATAVTERERADALRTQLEAAREEARAATEIAQAKAEAGAAELRDQLEQTRAQAEAALQEAAALKAAADAAGRGGRWARLRRAWRGG